jgi:hypothetical protein
MKALVHEWRSLSNRRTGHSGSGQMKTFLLIAAFLLSFTASARDYEMPDPNITPGAVLTTDKAKICQVGYTKTVRNVPTRTKNQVFRLYGLLTKEEQESFCHQKSKRGCEIDHLISLELGGSNAVENLWPQQYGGSAEKKDRLENRLHRDVCKGLIPLEQAQKEIAVDWKKAYDKRYDENGKARK